MKKKVSILLGALALLLCVSATCFAESFVYIGDYHVTGKGAGHVQVYLDRDSVGRYGDGIAACDIKRYDLLTKYTIPNTKILYSRARGLYFIDNYPAKFPEPIYSTLVRTLAPYAN